jgi:hypothetical protein
VIQVVASVVTTVLITPMVVLTYTDLRARREGLTTPQLVAETYR